MGRMWVGLRQGPRRTVVTGGRGGGLARVTARRTARAPRPRLDRCGRTCRRGQCERPSEWRVVLSTAHFHHGKEKPDPPRRADASRSVSEPPRAAARAILPLPTRAPDARPHVCQTCALCVNAWATHAAHLLGWLAAGRRGRLFSGRRFVSSGARCEEKGPWGFAIVTCGSVGHRERGQGAWGPA